MGQGTHWNVNACMANVKDFVEMSPDAEEKCGVWWADFLSYRWTLC